MIPDAPNTPYTRISWNGPYHDVSPRRDTVSDGKSSPAAARCRTCHTVAAPAHVTDAGKTGALAVWCFAHCPVCIRFRKAL